MRTVVNNKEVAHLWAHKRQSEARGSHFFFDGATIYSYGRHFPIARHIEHNGKRAILFTTRDYSNTTSKHKNYVRQSIPRDATVFYVEDVDRMPDGRDVVAKQNKAAEHVASARRARTYKESHLTSAQDLLNDAEALKEFFGIKCTSLTMAELGCLADDIAKARKIDAENKRKAELARIQAAKDAIENWKLGFAGYVPYNIGFAFGRIKGDELETTKGARVPVAHIKKVAPLVRSYITKGRTFKTNGHKIPLGVYQLTEIKEDGTLIAGCHVFQKEEVIRILDLVEKH